MNGCDTSPTHRRSITTATDPTLFLASPTASCLVDEADEYSLAPTQAGLYFGDDSELTSFTYLIHPGNDLPN